MKSFVTIYLLILFFISQTTAGIVHVPEDQPTIQAGINAALNGDTVLVSEGTFYENIDFKGKAIIVASYMIMDNDTTHRNNTIINGSQPTDPGEGSVVSFISGEDTTSVIYGFTITGGTGTLSDGTSRLGGGIFCYSSGARIKNNKIINNTITHTGEARGGGIGTFPWGNNNYTNIENNIIESNICNSNFHAQGGAVYMPQGTINNNIIRNNLVQGNSVSVSCYGGGIHGACDQNTPRYLHITNNLIENNRCTNSATNSRGGGVDTWGGVVVYLLHNTIRHNSVSSLTETCGGGVDLIYANAPTIIQGNTIAYNSLDVSSFGGGIHLDESQDVQIIENKIEGNSGADMGGGIDIYESSGTIIRGNEILYNSADTSGGGISIQVSNNITIDKNLIRENSAKYAGGIFKYNGNFSITNNIIVQNNAHQGGGIFGVDYPAQSGLMKIINNTFSGNQADEAGGMILIDQKNTMLNTICWGNNAPFAPEILIQAGVLTIAYSDIDPDSIQVLGGILNQLSGNITDNPLFVYGDSLHRLTTTGDTSMCLNTGIGSIEIDGTLYEAPETDFIGNMRPQPAGTRPDMGAWESDVVNFLQKMAASSFPNTFTLQQNYPNPFNPMTTIEFQIPYSQFITLKIYNLLGQEVAMLVSEKLKAGNYKYTWDGGGLASGLYLYKLQAGDFMQTRKMLLLK